MDDFLSGLMMVGAIVLGLFILAAIWVLEALRRESTIRVDHFEATGQTSRCNTARGADSRRRQRRLGIHPDCWGGGNNWAMAHGGRVKMGRVAREAMLSA